MDVHLAHPSSPSEVEDKIAVRSSVGVCAAVQDEECFGGDTDSGGHTDSNRGSHRDSSSSSSSSSSVFKKRQRDSGVPSVPPLSALQVWSIPYTTIILPTADIAREEEKIVEGVDLAVKDETDEGTGAGVIEVIALIDMNTHTDTDAVAALEVDTFPSNKPEQEVERREVEVKKIRVGIEIEKEKGS